LIEFEILISLASSIAIVDSLCRPINTAVTIAENIAILVTANRDIRTAICAASSIISDTLIAGVSGAVTTAGNDGVGIGLYSYSTVISWGNCQCWYGGAYSGKSDKSVKQFV
jgi:hypothetical protein